MFIMIDILCAPIFSCINHERIYVRHNVIIIYPVKFDHNKTELSSAEAWLSAHMLVMWCVAGQGQDRAGAQ